MAKKLKDEKKALEKKKKQREEEKTKKKEERKEKRFLMKDVVRIAETNVDGGKMVPDALRDIRGISFMLSNLISKKSGMAGKKLSECSDDEIKSLESIISEPAKHGIPVWMFNRRSDPETGNDIHLTVSTLQFRTNMDINEMKKLRSYKGVRHSLKLPVRGQRTRGAFRKSGKSVGVKKKK